MSTKLQSADINTTDAWIQFTNHPTYSTTVRVHHGIISRAVRGVRLHLMLIKSKSTTMEGNSVYRFLQHIIPATCVQLLLGRWNRWDQGRSSPIQVRTLQKYCTLNPTYRSTAPSQLPCTWSISQLHINQPTTKLWINLKSLLTPWGTLGHCSNSINFSWQKRNHRCQPLSRASKYVVKHGSSIETHAHKIAYVESPT